ncbi:hypothetical protein LCGC14_1664310 [marine sediment metagenome]|uniref:Uncharacterized protein n=1 Tax=marine sediment metagenome TaxID=412755 RepID=A0A0F9IFT5_9ZZZZ
MGNLYVKRFDTREVVSTIDLHGKTGDQAERVLRGLLRQMDTETYFVDDSEIEYPDDD